MRYRSTVHGHVRNYLMATWNHRQLSDNYANVIGAEIAYTTAPFHGFGYAGLCAYHLFSSDKREPDDAAGTLPKLELLDIKDPENRADLDCPDELSIAYQSDQVQAKAGRFSFSSPVDAPCVSQELQEGSMKRLKTSSRAGPRNLELHFLMAWLNALQVKQHIILFDFPVIADLDRNIAQRIGMLQPGENETAAGRAVFLIDPVGMIRVIICSPLNIGRNTAEIKRPLLLYRPARNMEWPVP